jgi:hypothetical protein
MRSWYTTGLAAVFVSGTPPSCASSSLHRLPRFVPLSNFGGEGVIDTIDPVEQEKHLKYNHLVANAAAIQNVIDLTRAVRDLQADGYFVRREDLAQLSPYQTRRLKRFGDYTLSSGAPDPFETDLVVSFPLEDAQESAATA